MQVLKSFEVQPPVKRNGIKKPDMNFPEAHPLKFENAQLPTISKLCTRKLNMDSYYQRENKRVTGTYSQTEWSLQIVSVSQPGPSQYVTWDT